MTVEVRDEAVPAAVFATQVIIGTILFSLVMLGAFGLSLLIKWMEGFGAPGWMIWGAHVAEKVIFGLDFFLFGLFLLSEALKFMVGLWKEWSR